MSSGAVKRRNDGEDDEAEVMEDASHVGKVRKREAGLNGLISPEESPRSVKDQQHHHQVGVAPSMDE